MSNVTLTSKVVVSYLGGMWKFDEVVWQAMGSLSMCTGFCIVIVSMAFSRHINVMVFAEAASGVVRIQTLVLPVLVDLYLMFSVFVMKFLK